MIVELNVIPTHRIIFVAALLILACTMISDAVISHIPNARFSMQQQQWWALANRYLFINTTLLMIVSYLPAWRLLKLIFALIIAACLLFSGSLYALCLLDRPPVPLLTPIAGMSMILLWLLVSVVCLIKFKK